MNRTTQIKAVTPTIVVTEARVVVFIHMLVHGFGSRDINVSFAIFCKELQPPIRRNFVGIEDMKWHGELDPISKTVEENAVSSSLNLNSLGRTEFTTKPLRHSLCYSTRLPYWLSRNDDLSVIDRLIRSTADYGDISTDVFPYLATDSKELCWN